MAVPSSGELSLRSIHQEITLDDYTDDDYDEAPSGGYSLTDASDGTYGTINTNNASLNRPNGSAPHQMSEFYSYNHDQSGGQQAKCFVAGTMITMWDMTYKPIEKIQVGDKIFTSNGTEPVTEIRSAVEPNIAEFIFSDGTKSTNTKNHPYYVIDKGWSSARPSDHIDAHVFEIGDICIKDDDTQVSLVKMINVKEHLMTYTFTTDSNTYYANNILVNSVIGNN